MFQFSVKGHFCMKQKGLSTIQLENSRLEKLKKRGGFKDRIFLVSVD